MTTRFHRLALALPLSAIVLVAASVDFAAAPALPAYFKPPAKLEVDPNTLVDEIYGEANIPNGVDDLNVKRGHHWSWAMRFTDLDESKESSWPEAWTRLQTGLTSTGWVLKNKFETNPVGGVFAYQKAPVDALIWFQIFGPTDIRVDLVEMRSFTPTLTVVAPAAKPETFTDEQPFPYLRPIANGKMGGTDADAGAFWLALKGNDEPSLISPGSVKKAYTDIEGISNLQFMLEYRSALTKAGWEIVSESQGLNQGDAVLAAHFTKNGRDIWTSLHYGGGRLEATVADITMDLVAALNRDCRVPMYGITFDFNKSTLRLEAESTLQGVLTALQRDTAMAIEVQGHTDNVGGDRYNQTLSQARADAVKTWLSGHGIAAARLSSKGYGLTQPIAGNDSDEGRAKNRRVVLAKAGCQK